MPITVKNFNKTTPKVGIYHNASLGLISVTDDGINWITIADKNLGASTVGGAGKVYQWGNNYGFNPDSYTTTSTAVNLTNYGPNNYYSSSVFNIARPYDTSGNLNLRGGVTGTKAAMKGPCAEGYHICSDEDLAYLINMMCSFGLTGTNNLSTYLKMPSQKVIYNNSVTTAFYYWTATGYNSANKLYSYLLQNNVELQTNERNFGFPIRPFKNEPVIPDNSRTVLYEKNLVLSPGIYTNTSANLITLSSDGKNWITIRDKNYGASVIYNYGDTLTANNCGLFFQWGNNRGFNFSGSITTSSNHIDASTYGPDNYYNDTTFAGTGTTYWESSDNRNLRGQTTGTNVAMRGPGYAGYHIPRLIEIQNLVLIGRTLGARTSTGGVNFSTYLRLPKAGMRNGLASDGAVTQQGQIGYYAGSETPDNDKQFYSLIFSDTSIGAGGGVGRSMGCNIRLFKNYPARPINGWTKIY